MISLAVFLGFFAFYLAGVSPAVYGGDTGELITAAHTLGVAHAPGYPLFSLAAKAGADLIPFGTIAYRVNVFSAAVMSGALIVFFRLAVAVLSDREGRVPALFATLLLGLAPVTVDQSRAAEVFGLNFLLVSAVVLCVWKWSQTPLETRARWLIAGGYLAGLGFGNHHTVLAVVPFLIWAMAKDRRPAVVAWTMMFGVLGATSYIYLPLRAGGDPAVNFGDPETWSRFWAVVTRREFGSLSLHPAALPFRETGAMIGQTARFFERVWENLGWTGTALTVFGIFTGWKTNRRWLIPLTLAGALVYGLAFELFSNLSPSSLIAQWRLERFFLLPLGFLCVLAGSALNAIPRAAHRRVIAAGVIAVCLAEPLVGFRRPISLRENFCFRDFAVSALRSIPRDGALVIDRVLFDEPTSSLLVATNVEGKRPDVAVFYRPGTLFEPVYGTDVLELNWPDRLRRQREVEERELAKFTSVRCLAFEKSNAPFSGPVMDGVLVRGLGLDSRPPARPVLLHRQWFGRLPRDYQRRLMDVHFSYFFGKTKFDAGDEPEGRRWFTRAMRDGAGMAWLASNIGGVFAQIGDDRTAEAHFEKAVGWDPYFPAAHYGRGYVALRKQDFAGAVREFGETVRLAPGRPEHYYMLGVAHAMAGDPQAAEKPWRRYLSMDPEGPMAASVKAFMAENKGR